MGIPFSQMWAVTSYIIRQRLKGNKYYPLVLMLEPLFRCNLKCAGCGKIQYPADILQQYLTKEQCLQAIEECGAPIISIPGGEPLLHPQMPEIVAAIVQRKKYVYLCTNAILLESKLDQFKPNKFFSFNIHLDGLREEHDRSVCCSGIYDKAISAIKAALARGFRVTTNTTIYEGTDPQRLREFCDEMTKLKVEAMTISPGYSYTKAPQQDVFLQRQRSHEFFRQLLYRSKGWTFNHSPLFLEFLAGNRHFECTPWGSPAYNIFGWQYPCYLLQEDSATTFKELLQKANWHQYGHKSGNPKCANCMVHSGHEPTAVNYTFTSFAGLLTTIRAAVFGPRIGKPESNSKASSSQDRT